MAITIILHIKLTVLDIINAIRLFETPYTIHKDTPMRDCIYVSIETSFTERVFHILIIWGISALHVRQPAINPINSISSCGIILDPFQFTY